MRVLVTGAGGVAGRAVCRLLLEGREKSGITAVRGADVTPRPRDAGLEDLEYFRCDTRTPQDVQQAMAGCSAVIHLAAWHCAHVPPVSDPTIFAVNVDGSYNVFEACRKEGVKTVVFASSMAYGFGNVYAVTKVLGEDLWRCYHEMTGASVALLRYHDFVPKSYLAFGVKLLRNGVDVRDVAGASVASLYSGLAGRYGRFMTIVHTAHGMPEEVVRDFRTNGLDWCEAQVPGSVQLLEKYDLVKDLPTSVEQHNLSEAERLLDWRPTVGFREFLQDLQARDARGEDVRSLWADGRLPE